MVAGLHNAFGAMLSTTVTVDVQVELFPFTSTTVKVTVFGPTWAHVKAVCESVLVAMAQLSFDPLSTSATVRVALPLALR